jgi:protocatechuate 3,4-dioxygenase beta subunit
VLTASHPEWSESTTTVEVKDAPASADVRLGRGGSIGGTVLGGARPVAGAQVTLSPAGESGMRMGGFMGGGEQSALTDEAGRFRFDRLNPGRYQLSAALRDQTSAPADAVLTGDDSQDVQLTLAAGALLKGVVSGLADNQLTGVA